MPTLQSNNEASHPTPVGALPAPKRSAAVAPPRRGAPRKRKGARGKRKTRERLSFPRTAQVKKACRALVKTGEAEFMKAVNTMNTAPAADVGLR